MILEERGCGCIPSPPDERDFPIGALLQRIGSDAPLPTSMSLRSFAGEVRNQSITSSCVAMAGTKLVAIRARKMGLTIPELSPLASYALTRGWDLVEGEALVDLGSMPRSFFHTARQSGVVSEARWPFDEGKINEPLPLDVFVAGAAAKVASYHAIEWEGEGRCQLIRETLHAGSAVGFAMPVDRDYMRLELGDAEAIWPGRTGPTRGRHYQAITGYGPGYFEVLGSWGLGFAYAGTVRIANDYIAQPECTDFYAVDVSPGGVT